MPRIGLISIKNMLVKNKTIQRLLRDKEKIISKGQELNRKLEKKAELFVSQILLKKGIKDGGFETIKETETEREHKNKLFIGNYKQLKEVFSVESMTLINEEVNKKFSDEINEIKSLEMQVAKINEKVTETINKEVKMDLKEFEQPRTIKLINNQILIEIVDVLEEFKEKYRNNKK